MELKKRFFPKCKVYELKLQVVKENYLGLNNL